MLTLRTATSSLYRQAVAAWPGRPGGAPTHLPLYDVGRHGHRRAPGVRSMFDQSSDLIVINLDKINSPVLRMCMCTVNHSPPPPRSLNRPKADSTPPPPPQLVESANGGQHPPPPLVESTKGGQHPPPPPPPPRSLNRPKADSYSLTTPGGGRRSHVCPPCHKVARPPLPTGLLYSK